MQQCARENDPLIKNNDSHQVYIVNDMPSGILINGQKLASNDTKVLTLKTPESITITDQSGHVCNMQTGTPPQYRIDHVDQGYFDVEPPWPPSKTGASCVTENLIGALPVGEQPLSQGSGVIFGAYDKDVPASNKCTVMKSQFSYSLNDSSQGKCSFKTLQFTLNGTFNGQTYNKVAQAAAKQGINPAAVSFDNVSVPDRCSNPMECDGIGLGQPGYYYVGNWDFSLSDVTGLTSGCQLSLGDQRVYSDTTGSSIHLSLAYSSSNK